MILYALRSTRVLLEEEGLTKVSSSNTTAKEHLNGVADTAFSSNEECGYDLTTPSIDRDCTARIEDAKGEHIQQMSRKSQHSKHAVRQDFPSSPKPRIPDGISIPDGEQDWLVLWDISDEQIERRIMDQRNTKTAERKALRLKQQEGKDERREARNVKRKAYRDIKAIWRSIKDDHAKERARLNAAEEEESKKIAVEVNEAERRVTLDLCSVLGFTIDNTRGTEDIRPRVLGMHGQEIDFDAIEGKHHRRHWRASGRKYVDLRGARECTTESLIMAEDPEVTEDQDFIKLDKNAGQGQGASNYNGKLRQKVHRAVDHAQAQKEKLVRQRAILLFKARNKRIPLELKTSCKVQNIKAFNDASKVLRKQAKHHAVESGLRKHAEVTGILPEHSQLTGSGTLPMPAHISTTAASLEMAALDPRAKQYVESLRASTTESPIDLEDT
ncbi:MAG: hypothetical protein Q9203_001801 [Teloschistes exilis]